MSLDQLAQDLVDVLKEMYPDPANAPKLLLVGHSMVRPSHGFKTDLNSKLTMALMPEQGGAVVVQACPMIQKFAQVIGCAVLDVVEG